MYHAPSETSKLTRIAGQKLKWVQRVLLRSSEIITPERGLLPSIASYQIWLSRIYETAPLA